MSLVAKIEGSRTVLEQKPAVALPAPRSELAGGFTQKPLGKGIVQLISPQGEPCGLCASQAVATGTLNLLNR